MPDTGDQAPDFTLLDQDGETVTLSDLRGQTVLVYFYPRDETPGCTRQACDIRDRWTKFTDAGVVVLGISPDTVSSHAMFRANHDLPHTLLADPLRETIETYGVWGEKVRDGRAKQGVIRTSFLVDEGGVIVGHWPQVAADSHADEILDAARRLAN